ncbi:16S rRNA (cytidine(1402)-2'-O)-methyltransferase [Campylobacter upsaliensis]|uniref:Ribosomal RNA small subunit methyltransferase I n=1 Tax=Campylobacter upsaliensis JV21 TaxID=888826 RepID=A0A828R1F9_CAMUP|nr:16S rRNA (cytidine(1402)-2'-O)-methyltransferase [Campylobacter upsaliensis]EAH7701042.1 16S rRNA (cytidine(1402)-2'-O)-methyltransferase [Campylobacter upsaliensis]EAK6757501.1 16S rRNA (cytidine(1402)-2'-O)-methyltransferase [Campylobacter upsaliensis]EBD1701216.1 16S rRNA (cytidine(1402)-2'-O)-methyltransferase [Campylobacter upsaliensis]EDP6857523.1 16S rRNA (cytidine(1402)-2'-O)-methyltransferase [Campylobacter upsaliensis]EDP6869787.1 16S rRNA (cytidine(1402)-2'-O)-methyltransferase [
MLYFIPTPIGNLSDISLRSLELLSACEIVFCEDTRVCKHLITLLNDRFKTCIKPQKILSLHTHNEKEVLEKLDLKLFEKNVAYLSDAGMPGISDPGFALIQFALKHKLSYEVLPGANAALVALVSSNLCEKEFIFLGFLANKGKQRQKEIENLLLNPYPTIIYEAPTRILALVQTIAKLEPERELFAMKEISKKFQTSFRGRAEELVGELKNANLNGEWVLVVAKSSQNFSSNSLCESDILALDLPLKVKSKLLAKMSGKNSKELYQKLLLSQNEVK